MNNGYDKKSGMEKNQNLWLETPASEADKEGDFDALGMQELWMTRIYGEAQDWILRGSDYQQEEALADIVSRIKNASPLVTRGQRAWRNARGKKLSVLVSNFSQYVAQLVLGEFGFAYLPEQKTTLTLAFYSLFVSQIEKDEFQNLEDALSVEAFNQRLEQSAQRLLALLQLLEQQDQLFIQQQMEHRKAIQPPLFEGFESPTMQQEGRLEDEPAT